MSGSRKNRFGFDSIEDMPVGVAPRRRGGGPMSSAVRDTAENLRESAEAKVEARQKNAVDARAFREAEAEGRVLRKIAVDTIQTDDLPRDRLDLSGVASADAMDELKASTRAYGQKEPIEVYLDGSGRVQLKKGWRRLTAVRALLAETGDPRFGAMIARVDEAAPDRLRHYVDMVEENILREDLTFAEMAQLSIEAASDPSVDGGSAEEMVNRLYGSLHKTKRSYIRSFVTLLSMFGDDLRFPKAVPRDLGVSVARALSEGAGDVGSLKRSLLVAEDADEQNALLREVLDRKADPVRPVRKVRDDRRLKYEFHVGPSKVTARRGEVRIKDGTDFTSVPRERLERAIAAFRRTLAEESGDG